jgi:hypothetical protein
VDKAIEFRPIPGICRRPGAAMPKPITEDDIAELIKGKKFEFNDWVADYTYWFVNKLAARQRELFFGHGGMVNMFLKPDKKTEPPIVPFSPAMRSAFPIFQKFDIDAQVAQTFALADEFQDKSKKLFGNGLENDPQFRGLRFILPLLNAQNFFNEVPGEREKWFQLFDVYINESPADNGILLASAKDLDEPIIDLVRQMREENLEYPLR